MKMIRRVSGLLLALVLLAGLLPLETLAAPEKYGLKIAGVEITSDNWMNLPYKEAFQYAPATKELVITNDLTLTDSSVDTLIESSVDGLTIRVRGNFTLTMNNSSGTFLKLNKDATITTTANRDAGSLILRNNSPGGTGILVNDCALTMDYLFDLDIGNVDYGLRGQGKNAALNATGTAMKIDSSTAAISGFSKELEILYGEILTPEDGQVSGGDLCDKKGKIAEAADIRNTAWADVLTDTDAHNLLKQDLSLSTLGEWDPETETYKDYDIDLMELYNAASGIPFLTFYAFNLIQGSVPPGMSLVLGPSNKYPSNRDYTALRLRGRPTKPGLFVAGLWISGRTSYNYVELRPAGNVRIAVNYEPPKPYNLWIDGFQANSSNLTDITNDGTFSYDPGSKTLTIHKSYDSFTPNLMKSQIDGLIVDIPEGVTLSAGGTVFQLEKNTRFKGSGQLTVKSTGNYGIQVKNGAFLNIRDADLAVSAAGTAVAGSNGGEKLFVTDARLSAKGGTKGVAGFSGGITLTEPGVAISEPPGGKVSGGSIVKSDDSDAPEVLIAPVKTYDLSICSHTVTEANRKDVLGDGVFSFDGDKTLHIKGDCTSNFTIINSGIDGLVIAVDQDSVLSIASTGMGQPMFLRGSTTITGPGSLKLKAASYNSGLELGHGGDLTLKDLVLTVEDGNWGIQGSGTYYPNKLTVENSSVRVSINNEWNTAIQYFANGIELTGCVITNPSNGKVIDAEQGRKIVNSDGSNAKEVTISPLIQVSSLTLNKETMNLAVGGSETLTATVTPENASLKTVSWSSSNPAVAEVDGSGKVTGKSKGEAVITAKSNGGPWSKTCKVTVSDPIAVTGVTLNKTTLSLPVGNSDYLSPIVSPSNATNKAVTWQSDKPAVAAVTADGKVTAVAEGTAKITVKTKDGGKTAVCTVTVTKAIPVTDVTLNRTELTLPFTGSETLTATVSPADASNKLVTWSSGNPAVAQVNGAGKVSAVSDGTATITVKTADGGKTASCTVTVEPQIHVTGVKLDKTELTLVLGQPPFNEDKLTPTVSPADATFQGVTWKSSDPSIVSVYHGTVTAKALGTADITATTDDGGKTATCKVTVINPVHVTGISIVPDERGLFVGGSDALTPIIKPDNATNKLVIWESNRPDVASVNSYGVVAGKSLGSAVITGKTVDGGKTTVCIVNVVWNFNKSIKTITTSSAATPNTPVVVASYDAKGQFLGATFVTSAREKAPVVKYGAKSVTIMWIDLATGKPKGAAEKVTLS